MSRDYVVAIGGSMGGLNALIELFDSFPSYLDAPVVVALHSNEQSKLADVLQTKSDLSIIEATDGQALEKGFIYIAPPARHVFFKEGSLRVSEIVRDSGFRPSIDAMFMSMALEYERAAIGVVLSGTMTDGMRGAQVIYDMGGRTIVQDPTEAKQASMPKSVIRHDHPQAILRASELGQWLEDLIGQTDDAGE